MTGAGSAVCFQLTGVSITVPISEKADEALELIDRQQAAGVSDD